MKITSIKQQLKNPERASIFVDGKYAFSLSLNELVAEKLKIDQVLGEADLKRLKKQSEDGKLRARALEWVLNRPRSLKEFRDYMFRKKAEAEMSMTLSGEFVQKGYLNDAKFSQWLIELLQRRGKSQRAIKNELLKKGVSREVIEETLISDSGQEMVRLKELLNKKRTVARYRHDEMKLKQYLLRQGFSYSDIKSALADAD